MSDEWKPWVTVEVTAPVDGDVTVDSLASMFHVGAPGADLACRITESTEGDTLGLGGDPHIQWWEKSANAADNGTLSGTRSFEIAAGMTATYELRCREFQDGGFMLSRTITAIFTPAG